MGAGQQLLAPGDRALRRLRPVQQAQPEHRERSGLLSAIAGAAGFRDRALDRFAAGLEPADAAVDVAEEPPGARQGSVIARAGEHVDRAASLIEGPLLPADRIGRLPHEQLDEREGRAQRVVADRRRAVDRHAQDVRGAREVTLLAQCLAEIDRELDPAAVAFGQRGHRALDEIRGRRDIPAGDGPAPGGTEPRGGADADRVRFLVEGTQLAAEAVRLLEVIADDLLELEHPRAGHSLEPVAEALVELRACPLEQSLIRGVAQQRVMEAVRGVPGERRLNKVEQLLRVESRDRRRHALAQRGRRELLDRASLEDRTGDRSGLEEGLLLRRQLVDARREQRRDRRRHVGIGHRAMHRPTTGRVHAEEPLVDERRDDLLDEQGIPLGRLRDALLDDGGQADRAEDVLDDARAVRVGQRCERDRRRVRPALHPAGVVVDEIRTGGRDHEDRGLRRRGNVRDELEHVRLGPVNVVEDDDDRPLAGDVLRELRRGPVRLLDREHAAPQTHSDREPFGDVGRAGAQKRADSQLGDPARQCRSPRSPRPGGPPQPAARR